MDVTRYFYDTEFIDTGTTIDLISIGIVCDDGRKYAAVNADAPWERIRDDPWLMMNVVPHLPTIDVDPDTLMIDVVGRRRWRGWSSCVGRRSLGWWRRSRFGLGSF